MKKLLLNPWTAILTLIIFVGLRLWDPSFVESVRLRYFDTLITSQQKIDIPVNIVNIDEDSLDKYGQFPFPRGTYADIIKDLYKRNAGLVVFNVLTPEKDRFNQDAQYASVLSQTPTVIPELGSTKSKNIARTPNTMKVGQGPQGRVVEYPGILANTPQIEQVAAGVGIANTFPEIDGVVRRMPLVILSGENLYPALALEALRVAAQDTKIQVKIGDSGVEALRIPKLSKIPTDGLSRVWIDWSQTPKEYSLTKLPNDFKGEIVIVGLSAAGLVNPVATAKGEIWPQYMQASLMGTLLNGITIQRPDWADMAEVVALAVLGLLLLFLTRWTYVGIIGGVIIIGSSIPLSSYLYSSHAWLVDITCLVSGLVLVMLHAYGIKFVSEFLQKQQIKKQFGSYLSPDLVAKLQKNPELLVLGGEELDLSIMFTDVRGFTSISEHYGRDVQGLTKIMNRYMTAMTRKILENDGTLDKYIGDAQMAFWNAPLDNRQHCKNAVKAALEMLGELKGFNDEITAEGTPAFGMGIGINTGVVVVGNMGSEQRFDYTCLGDAVNLSSRLEGQSKNYGVLIVLGPTTAERLNNEYFTIELDCIAVKGKKEGVTIYTVFYNPTPDQADRWETARKRHNDMLSLYRAQEWDFAKLIITELIDKFDGQMNQYYSLWADRIEEMRSANLPKDWDGVYRATSK